MADVGRSSWAFKDNPGQEASFTINTVVLNAGNIASNLTALATLQTALEAITLGRIQRKTVVALVDQQASGNATNVLSRRETKFLVRGVSTAGDGEDVRIEIPCVNLGLAGLMLPNSEFVDLTSTEGAAFVTALQAVARTKSGQTFTVQSIQFVGRNT